MGAGIGTGGPLQFYTPARESAQGGLMSLAGVAARLRVSRRELYRIRKADPTFPAPVDLDYSRRAVIFRAADIHNWIRAKG
jgi:predicted DNA-binding transcriptional regulator AlpA